MPVPYLLGTTTQSCWFSCRAGVCSTCRTKVISGTVEMDQNYALEEWELEKGYVLACQSRVKTPTLELDYDEK